MKKEIDVAQRMVNSFVYDKSFNSKQALCNELQEFLDKLIDDYEVTAGCICREVIYFTFLFFLMNAEEKLHDQLIDSLINHVKQDIKILKKELK